MEQTNNTVDNLSVNLFSVTPYPPGRPDIQVSDGDKAGATLLFSGVFLGLVGITFTVMGWIKYEGIANFEWTQLLGPILLSVGVTFALIAVCKFKMLTCKSCKQSDDRPLEGEQAPSGQSFVFTGINQPITFHGATVVQYIPPPYAAQEGMAVNPANLQTVRSSPRNVASSRIPPATTTCPPQYYTIFPLDNPAFCEEETYAECQVPGIANESLSTVETLEPPEDLLDEDTYDFCPPPPYEAIYPVVLA
ncbi:transmembrane protein 174 [Ambystoma mexicanum]|uniref:transmembrane protein 174 n=1 Tax=Ambystoma mexicanum TaxID=8296 RepID=UPI0037E87721